VIKLFNQIAFLFIFQISLNGQAVNPVIYKTGSDSVSDAGPLISEYSIDKIKSLYYSSFSHTNEIIYGRECFPYSFVSLTTPLLFSGTSLSTTLYLNNRKYSNVLLQYDTYLDELIYRDTSKIINSEFPRITLNKDLVQGFSFYSDGEFLNFKHLTFPPDKESDPGDGYYEIGYDGPSMFIIKHTSTQYTNYALTEYKYFTIRYILLDGKYIRVTNMKDFLPYFGAYSQEIKEFMQRTRMKPRKVNKTQIAEILKFYDSLAHK
jgi:hypothetical protein